MRIAAYAAFAAALVCGYFRFFTGKYVYSALISLLCGATVVLAGGGNTRLLLAAGLFASVIADWFLCHQAGRSSFFLCGVAGFFIAHCLFCGYAAAEYSFGLWPVALAGALLAGYCAYMFARVMPGVAGGLKLPVFAYMLASIASMYLAMASGMPAPQKALYTAGIAAILFSDTMIAENIFVGVKRAGRLVHPTYYACHWLLALSALIK